MYKGLFLGMFVGALISRIQTANCVAYGNVISNLQEAAGVTDDQRGNSELKNYGQTNIGNSQQNSNIDGGSNVPQSSGNKNPSGNINNNEKFNKKKEEYSKNKLIIYNRVIEVLKEINKHSNNMEQVQRIANGLINELDKFSKIFDEIKNSSRDYYVKPENQL
ncbi:hypothetical protein AYI68_g6833 [Smittium mucronatum]|uniref:Uncharacterized protein n=1 Tax=Smittium mucronatum TaxID=133383 RepID=A0A1R0GQF7_9FUNG|nr:hypothetical protein AYI68_g6833 [Smittium mucronatum]